MVLTNETLGAVRGVRVDGGSDEMTAEAALSGDIKKSV